METAAKQTHAWIQSDDKQSAALLGVTEDGGTRITITNVSGLHTVDVSREDWMRLNELFEGIRAGWGF